MTCGLEVLVHEVMAAMPTAPWSISKLLPSASRTCCGLLGRSPMSPTFEHPTGWSASASASVWLAPADTGSDAGNDSALASSTLPAGIGSLPLAYSVSTALKECFATSSGTRSCGRLGPASDGTIVERSSSRVSE